MCKHLQKEIFAFRSPLTIVQKICKKEIIAYELGMQKVLNDKSYAKKMYLKFLKLGNQREKKEQQKKKTQI